MKPKLTYMLIGLFLVVSISSQQEDITQFTLNTQLNVTQTGGTLKYFSVQISNPQDKQILLISVSTDITTFIGIYLSRSDSPDFNDNQYPNWTNYTHQCFYRSVDTCALELVQQKSINSTDFTVYFSVDVLEDCSYTLSVARQKIFQVSVSKKYTVSFQKVEAVIVQLPGTEFYSDGDELEEIVIFAQYASAQQGIGYFQMIASLDELPDSSYRRIYSESLNAFNKLLKLPKPESLNSSTYYILVQGTNATKLNFSIFPIFAGSLTTIQLNTSRTYITNKQQTYTYSSPFAAPQNQNITEPQFLPIFISLYAYRGNGQFVIDYCSGLYNFTFQNINGENGQITLSARIRSQCYNKIIQNGGLLVQNLQISIAGDIWDFGYTIYLQEGDYELTLYPGVKQYGVLLKQDDSRKYSLFNYLNHDGDPSQMTVLVSTISGSLTYSIQQCHSKSKLSSKVVCQLISDLLIVSANDSINLLNYTCPKKSKCSLIIQQSGDLNEDQIQDSQFIVSVSYTTQQVLNLMVNTPIIDFVQLNQYKYYTINLTQLSKDNITDIGNYTQLKLRNTLVNGDIIILTSMKIPNPQFSDLFVSDSDIMLTWEGLTTYTLNKTQLQQSCIYISVLGDAQSIYYLQYTLNTTPNIPERYLNIIDNAQSNYVLNDSNSYILLKYSSHVIPYTIVFQPKPDCIRFANKLPIESQCIQQIPTKFYDKVVYFNISQNFVESSTELIKFSIFANSGGYTLEKNKALIVGCLDACYQYVSVYIDEEEAKIIHTGQGSIKQTPNGNQTSNEALTLYCANPPCSYQLNASLPYGGSMQISFQSSAASEIQWRAKSFTFNNNTKNFYMRIPKYSSQEDISFMFYAEAVTLEMYYNIISLDQKYSNTASYEYPTQSAYDQVVYGDPLRSLQIVAIPEYLLQDKKCLNPTSLCVITFSLYSNSSVQYNQQYIQNGIGYYSSNVFSYQLQLNAPRKIKRSYSLSYFKYNFDENTPNNANFRIQVAALSNCRPMIKLQNSNKMYYNSVELPAKMPGQTYIKYAILTSQLCLFETTLSSVQFQVILSNIKYPMEYLYANQSECILIHHHEYDGDQLTIQTTQTMESIAISKLNINDVNGSLPTFENNIAMVTQSDTLQFTPQYQTSYLISLKKPVVAVTPNTYTYMILTKPNKPILLLHNQQQKYTFATSNTTNNNNTNDTYFTTSSVSYTYFSDTNYYLFVNVNRNKFNLTIEIEQEYYQKKLITNQIISNTSQPWIVIDYYDDINTEYVWSHYANNKLKKYIITFQMEGNSAEKLATTLKLHVEEDGVLGLPKLYDGIAHYDSFLHLSAKNCYQYQSEMILGRDSDLIIDISFYSQQPPQQNDTTNNILVSGSANLFKQSSYLQQSFYQISPTTYRLQTSPYYANSIYKICFQSKSVSVLGKQYLIMINMADMPMLYNNQIKFENQSKVGQNVHQLDSYNLYEYVNNADDYIELEIKIVNCIGKSKILASGSYSDMRTGKMTEIKPEYQWYVGGVGIGIANVSRGYYYLGLKNTNQQQQLYQIQINDAAYINNQPQILTAMFGIDWRIPASAQAVFQGGIQYVAIIIPPIISLKQVQAKKIVYKLYLMNLQNPKIKELPYSIDVYTRCLSLMPDFGPLVIVDGTNSTTQVKLLVPLHIFEPMSNISIRGQVTVQVPDKDNKIISNRTLVYYYGHEEIKIIYDSPNGSFVKILKVIAIITVIVVVTLGVALAIKIYIRNKRRNVVSFQASQFNHNQVQMQSRRGTVNPTRPTGPANIINTNVGYGQFIDEIP